MLRDYDQLVPTPSEIIWPSAQEIKQEQCKYSTPPDIHMGSNGFIIYKNCVWIPLQCTELQLNIMVISQCGSLGNRVIDSTKSIIHESFTWNTLDQDVDKFTNECFHCVVSRSGECVPRPLTSALHARRPNEVVHIDFLNIGEESQGIFKYILLIRSLVWLWRTASAKGDAAVYALTRWIATFGVMDWIVTDQGPQFTCHLFKEITSELKVNQHLTRAYSR